MCSLSARTWEAGPARGFRRRQVQAGGQSSLVGPSCRIGYFLPMMQQIVLVSYAQQKNKIDVRTCACSEAAVPSVNKCKPTFDTRSCRYKCAFSGRRLPKNVMNSCWHGRATVPRPVTSWVSLGSPVSTNTTRKSVYCPATHDEGQSHSVHGQKQKRGHLLERR